MTIIYLHVLQVDDVNIQTKKCPVVTSLCTEELQLFCIHESQRFFMSAGSRLFINEQ